MINQLPAGESPAVSRAPVVPTVPLSASSAASQAKEEEQKKAVKMLLAKVAKGFIQEVVSSSLRSLEKSKAVQKAASKKDKKREELLELSAPPPSLLVPLHVYNALTSDPKFDILTNDALGKPLD